MTVRSIKDVDAVADLVDRLRLDHAARARGAVVVEGPGDARVLGRALEIDERRFFPVNGRDNVLRVAEQLDIALLSGVICVADRDFDDAAQQREAEVRLVFTDNGDLEAMIILSPAFARVLAEWAAPTKLTRLGGDEGVRTRVWNVVAPVSVLRRASASSALGLVFDAVDLHDVITRAGLELRLTGYLDRLARASGTSRPLLQDLLEAHDVPPCPVTARLLVRGRDVVSAIEVALTRVVGGLQRQQAQGLVEPSLRLALGAKDFDHLPFRTRFEVAVAAAAA